MLGVTGIEPVTPMMSTQEGHRFNALQIIVLLMLLGIMPQLDQFRVCTMSAMR